MAAKKTSGARKYSEAASAKVEAAMRKRKRGALTSGRSGRTIVSTKQAIAIGLSEARAEGKRVPKKRASEKKKLTGAGKKRASASGATGAGKKRASGMGGRSARRSSAASATRRGKLPRWCAA